MRMPEVRDGTLCACNREFQVDIGREDEYRRAAILFHNRGKHPSFIGKANLKHARNGGLLFFTFRQQDIGVVIINPRTSVLVAMNVMPEHRGHGLGKAIMNYVRPNWVRCIESTIPFFESCGYRPIGKLLKGRKLNVQIMVRNGLCDLAGRIAAIDQ